MPEVSIDVAGRSYRVGCGEGEEEHLQGIAERIDVEATRLARKMGQMTEGRLMLMTAIMLADKLADAEAGHAASERKLARVQKEAEAQKAPLDMFGPEREEEIAKTLDALAERIELLAGQIEEPA